LIGGILEAENNETAYDVLMGNADLVKPIITPILFYADLSDPRKWLSGGTVFFVSTDRNSFIVTAEHVIAERDSISKGGKVITFIGGDGYELVDISSWEIIDRNKEIDICTIQIPASFEPSSIGKSFLSPRKWPVEWAKKEEQCMILGYPAQHRGATQSEVLGRIAAISDFITDVGPLKFLIADEKNERGLQILEDGLLEPEHFGGMSGSPILAHRDGDWLELVGVFIEGGGIVDGMRSPFWGAHIGFVDPNGSILTELIPPRF
jgi:hypothetical protein